MSDRLKTAVAIAIILLMVFLVVFVAGRLISGRSVVSPVPDENPIRIIILTPAPTPPFEPAGENRTM